MDEVMTLQEVASYLKIDYATVLSLTVVGTLRAFRVGHVWRIARADIERLMGRHELRVIGARPRRRQRAALPGSRLKASTAPRGL
jgi:excisionase family DNA binding protein